MRTNDQASIVLIKIRRAILIACTLSVIPVGAANATCTGIACSCSISAEPLNFGTYNPINSSNVDAAGNVSVSCGALLVGFNVSYEMTLSSGGSGNLLNREMSNGGDTIAYNLYTNSSRTTIWGDGAGGTGSITNSYLLTLVNNRTDNFPIYGRVLSGQNVSAGAYSDSLVATVIF